MMKPEVQRAKQRRREREMCPVHSYMRHGKEAQELRKGIEEIVKTCRPCVSTAEDGCTGCHIVEELEALLDRVDARDSLAYLERCPEDVKRRTNAARNK